MIEIGTSEASRRYDTHPNVLSRLILMRRIKARLERALEVCAELDKGPAGVPDDCPGERLGASATLEEPTGTPGTELDERIAELVRRRAEDPNPPKGVSLARFVEVIEASGRPEAERLKELLRSRRVRTPEGTGTLLWCSREQCGVWLHDTGKTIWVHPDEVNPGGRKRCG